MRFLLPAIGIIALIATAQAVQFHLSSTHVAEAGTKLSISVYDLHANKRDVNTLPEQGAPLP